MDLQFHGFDPPADNVCRVNSKPEKQMAAIQTKNTNSAIIARKALVLQFSLTNISKKIMGVYKTTTLFFTAKNASLGEG